MALVIETRSDHGNVTRTTVRAGTIRLNVRPGDVFRIYDSTTGKAPASTVVRQMDKSILIDHLNGDGDHPDSTVVLSGFYSSCSVSSACHLQLPGEDNGLVDITASSPVLDARPDGSFLLHSPAMNAGTDTGAGIGALAAADGEAGAAGPGQTGADHAADSGHEPFLNESTRPIIYGLGGAAVLGLAAAGGGGGGGGGGGAAPAPQGNDTTPPSITPPVAPPTPPVVPPSATDPKFAVTHASVAKGKIPTLTGTGTPGSAVKIEVDANDDKVVDASYTVTVNAAGQWAANLATLKPDTGALPATGLSTASSLTLTETLDGKPVTLPAFKLTADDTPPAAPTISPVATDNIINAAEAAQPLKLSGKADPTSLVKVTLGTQTWETTANAAGDWEVDAPASSIPNTPTATLSVTATDLAGNVSTAATQALTIDKTPPPAPVVQFSGGTDNYVNAVEKAAGTTITGTAEANGTVKVTVGTISHEVKAGADGKWNTAFTAAELPAEDGTYVVSATATDAAGNASLPSTGGLMTIDTRPPTVSDVHAGGTDRVRSGTPFFVSGKAEAGSKVSIEYTKPTGLKEVHDVAVQDGTGDVAWVSPIFTSQGPLLGTTQATLHITVTDKAGNTTVLDHNFVVGSRLFPLGDAGEATTPALKSLDLLQDDSASSSSTASTTTHAPSPSSAQLLSGLLPPEEQHGLALI